MAAPLPPGDEALFAGEEALATALGNLLDAGVDAAEAAYQLVAPLESSAARRWAAMEWTPGLEHRAGTLVDTVRALLVTRGEAPLVRGRVLVVSGGGEWHVLPARLAALVLRLHGWDAVFLGSLGLSRLKLGLAEEVPARALVVCCTVTTNLPAAARRVAAAHGAGLAALAVGPGFGADGEHAERVGADAWAPSAGAAEAFERLPAKAPFAAAVAPHPECAQLRSRRAQLVDAAVGRMLLVRPDAARRFSRSDALAHRRMLAGLLRGAEAALLVGDDDLLFDQVRRLIATRGTGEGPSDVSAAIAALAGVVHAPCSARLLGEAEVRAVEARSARHRRPAVAGAGAPGSGAVTTPVAAGEAARLASRDRLRVLGGPPDPRLEDVTRVAATACAAPLAGLAFVDSDRVRLAATVGALPPDEPRATSVAAWAVLEHEPLVVPDAGEDRRFAAHPLVVGPPHVRFFAAAPILGDDEVALGALFVADVEARRLEPAQYDALRSLARHVSALLGLRATELEVAPAPAGGEADADGERARLLRRLVDESGGSGRLLRTREVALLFDVSERTVNYWARQGRLPSRQTAGGHRRYAAGDVLQLFRSSQLLVGGRAGGG